MKTMKVKFSQWNCETWWSTYRANGDLALVLVPDHPQDVPLHSRETVAVASVCIAERPVGRDYVWVKDYSENEGMHQALVAAGVIHPVQFYEHRSGWVSIRAYMLTDEAKLEMEAHLCHPAQN